ncbi:MAG: MBL fold metallo-hydrolase [Collinsella sp.]
MRRPIRASRRGLLAEGDTRIGRYLPAGDRDAGHTPGGIVLFAATEQGNIAFVGDTLSRAATVRTDLSGGDEAAILRSLSNLPDAFRPIPFA